MSIQIGIPLMSQPPTIEDLTDLGLLGCGRLRAVFLLPGGRNVLKIPLNESGISANYSEAYRYKYRSKNGLRWNEINTFKLARCRLLGCLLVMEYVKPGPIDERPKWADFVDCQQVGLNRQNEWVAYDYE